MVSHFPNNVQPNKYLQMWWGVQQECPELHAAYIPRVLDLVADVTGRVIQLWRQEDCKAFADLFYKGLWDPEAVYMDRYFPREVLLAGHSKKKLVDKARHLDQSHGPSGRSYQGKFHPWRQWLISC